MTDGYHQMFRDNQRTNNSKQPKKNNKIAFGTKIPPPLRTNPITEKKFAPRNNNNVEIKPTNQRARPEPQPRPYEYPLRQNVVRQQETPNDVNDTIRKPIRFPSKHVNPPYRNGPSRVPSPRDETNFRIERRKRQSPAPTSHRDHIELVSE